MVISFKDYLEESRGLHVFDIDETLMRTNAKIHVKDKDGNHVKSLDNQQFNDHKLEHGHHYDFSEFKDSRKFHDESTPIHPMIRKVQKLQHHIKAGDHKSKIIMSTARSDFDDKQPVLDKFKKHGIDMDKIHLHRAGNIEGNHKPAEKKNVILRKHLDTGNYDHVHFYDDSKTNLDHFHKLKDEYPHIKFHAHHVDHAGKTKRYVPEGRDWHKPQQKANWGGRGTAASRKALAKKFSDARQVQQKKDEDERMKQREATKK